MPRIRSYKELHTFKIAYAAAMDIFWLSRRWPVDERYSLTDQIRKSSRSVCTNMAEAWRKRRFPNHFVSKLSDADMESGESQLWLDIATDCGYLSKDNHDRLHQVYDQVCAGLVQMMDNPEQWCTNARSTRRSSTDHELPE